MTRLIFISVLFLATLHPAAGVDRAATVDRSSADVSLIAAWVAGVDDSKVFERPFGDRGFITDAKNAIFYTDVENVAVPAKLRRVPYDFINARMQVIRNGHKVDPAVLITRSIAEDPKEGIFNVEVINVRKAMANERYYYVEVAIGNLAWHWMKVVMYEVDGKLKVEFRRSAVS